ncbi:MAG: caspase family protein [Elusimicrobia bacterium]|nr:caspase family protein [Elusimicrobiota bacterium]
MKKTAFFLVCGVLLACASGPARAAGKAVSCGCYCGKWIDPPCSKEACQAACTQEPLPGPEQEDRPAAPGLTREDVKRMMDEAAEKAAARAAEKAAGAQASEAAAPIVSDVDQPGFQAAENPDDYAMVVGVEKYPDLPAAQFAERDAEAVKRHLVALGYPERNIKSLLGGRATRAAMSAQLESWLPRHVKPGSRVFFYFSGHGAPDPTSGQAYLVPSDGDPNYLDKTGFPLKRLYAGLGALKARKVVVALDSCFSGAGGRSVLPEGARPLVLRKEAAAVPGRNILLFAAAAPDEITSTIKEQGHGAFTYYFLKGLSGGAQDKSGAVTPGGLYRYLKPKVQNAASVQNREQTPVLEGDAAEELVRFR